jgi:lysophospholipase L1-like esterase
MRRATVILLVGVVGLAALALVPLLPLGVTQPIETGSAAGSVTVADRVVWSLDACVNVSWAVEGVSALYVNEAGVPGEGSREVCLRADGQPMVEVQPQTGDTLELTVPVMVYLGQPWVLGGAAVALILVLVGAGMLFTGQNPTASRGRQIASVVELVLFGSLLSFGLLEGGMRLWFGLAAPREDYLRYMAPADEVTLANTEIIPLPHVGYGAVPGEDGVNERGFRNPPVALPKPDGTFRILALGGSTTFGQFVEQGDDYPAQLAGILRDDYGYDNVEIVNGGVNAYRTINSFVNLGTRGLETEPDMVIVYHSINDTVLRWSQPDCYRGENPVRGIGYDTIVYPVAQPLNPSVAVRFTQIQLGLIEDPNSFQFWGQPTNLCDNSVTEPTYIGRLERNPPIYLERNIISMYGIAHAHGLPMMVATQTYDRDYYNNGSELDRSLAVGQEEHNAVVRGLDGRFDDLYVYDFDGAFEYDPDEWFRDGIHLNERGLRRQAEMFAAFIHENGLIDGGALD